ncbi:transposase domain-containing protein [Mycolicibacterium gilvum]|uniref:transposase domain-containing protein n=1 Tax=Mycolicibacterium gilvum TaxID=1804 RepID=UPI003CC7D907
MLREPRRLDHTICTAVAPEAVFTVRTWAIRAAYDPKLVRKFPLPAHQHRRSQTYAAAATELLIKVRYEDVLSQLTDGLAWASGWREQYQLPGKSAIFQARERLGSQPLAALFARVARPLGAADTPGTWVAGLACSALLGLRISRELCREL